jgi:putative transposase
LFVFSRSNHEKTKTTGNILVGLFIGETVFWGRMTCQDFKKALKKHSFIQSLSHKGDCWDNAVAESFLHTLKTQLIYYIRFNNFGEAERILFKYIEIYYNQRRKFSANGWKAPAHCE